jgi:hypothetical protein
MKTSIFAAAVALPDRELLTRIGTLAGNEREATAELVAHLAALESRPSAYAAEGYGSLFDYCVGALGLSEDAACNRIEAARACRQFPVIVDLLAAGRLTLTSVRKLRNHLTPENHEAVLRKAAHRNKEQIEALIAELAPRPDVPAMLRKLPGASALLATSETAPLLDLCSETPPPPQVTDPANGSSDAEADHHGTTTSSQGPPPLLQRTLRPVVQALAPERYRVQFTIGQATHDRLRRVQALLRRQVPDGDPGVLFDRALRLLEEVESKKRGFAAKPPRPRSQDAARNGEGRSYDNRIRSGTDRKTYPALRDGRSAYGRQYLAALPASQPIRSRDRLRGQGGGPAPDGGKTT